MKNILVPLAASQNPQHTLQYAIDLAEVIKGNVYVLADYNVVSRAGSILKVEAIIERETKEYARSFTEQVNRRDVQVITVTARGNLNDLIGSLRKELDIDLVVVSSNSDIKNENYLSAVSGSIIKQMEVPALIVPEKYTFKVPATILTAFRSGVMKRKSVLKPLEQLSRIFHAEVHLLFVKTPKHTEEDLVLNDDLKGLSEKLTTTENSTTFQGVLEHFQEHKPEMLCVFRRKRGFFTKLWEKNIILKREFHCNVPVLVLRGKM